MRIAKRTFSRSDLTRAAARNVQPRIIRLAVAAKLRSAGVAA